MKRFVCCLVIVLASGCRPSAKGAGGPDGGTGGGTGGTVARVWPPSRAGYVNPIPAENAQPGDPSWRSFTTSWAHQVEAYADRVSAKAGDSVAVKASSSAAQSASVRLYRLGWYGGAGARLVFETSASLTTQPACPNDTTTGVVRCAWQTSASIQIPADAVSGLYLVRVVRQDGFGAFVPLVVRDDRQSDLFFQSSVLTFQAYNGWGGESLYTDADDGIAGHKAVQVSFDRPYSGYQGTADLLRWEVHLARFLERFGYDVSYTTNLDVVREGAAGLARRGAFLSVAHDEYWPGEERDIVEAARDAGVPLFFLGANPAYWKVRLSDPGVDGNPRTVTCYKQFPANDPLRGQPDATGRFRDPPFNRPEESLVGVMYEGWMLMAHPMVVTDASSFLYAGTGLASGDTLPLLVGYEYDRTFGSTAQVVARSPVVDAEGKPGFAESTVYTAPSGALVFGAGTIYWSLGLDGAQEDARVERMTANLFQKALGLPIPPDLTQPPAAAPQPVQGTWASDVSTVSRPQLAGAAGVVQLPDSSLLVADARASRIFRVDASGATPWAGDGNPSGAPAYDNVPALQARFFQPTALAADASGTVYVSDTHNHVLRMVKNGIVSTLAGTLGASAYADGTGSAARFSDPMGLAWLDAKHLLVADSGNHAIRSVDVTTGAVTTVAIGHGGDEHDGPASSATFYFPTAVAAAPDGRVFFVASSTSSLKVIGTDAARTITTLVSGGAGFADGAGNTARMLAQGGLVWGGDALYVSDAANQRIRRVVPGSDAASTTVTTFAGSGRVDSADGTGDRAAFGLPLGLFAAPDQSLLLVDGMAGALRRLRR